MHRAQVDVEADVVGPIPAGPYATVSGCVWVGCVRRGCDLQAPDSPRATAGTMGTRIGATAHEPGEDLMSDVIDRLVVAMNAHDLDAAAGFFHGFHRDAAGRPPVRKSELQRRSRTTLFRRPPRPQSECPSPIPSQDRCAQRLNQMAD